MSSYFNYEAPPAHCIQYLNIPGALFVREDTTLRQILVYNGANPEYILLDFSLNTGDTLRMNNQNFIIDSVTLATVNNIVRRRQWYYNFGGPLGTIEGIGNAINFPYSGFGEWNIPYLQLKCFTKNGTTQYFHYPLDSPCVKKAPVVTSDLTIKNISLNFSENILTVKNIIGTSTLSVFDQLGNKVFSEKIENDYAKDLSSVLQNGFYIVSVSDGKIKAVLKIVVK